MSHFEHWRGIVPAISIFAASLCPSLASSIQGIAWLDADRDGIRGPSEPGLPGLSVILFGIGGNTNVFTTISDPSGIYNFSGTPPGNYQIYVSAHSGFNITHAKAGTDDSRDSDLVQFSYFPPVSGRTDTIAYLGTPVTNIGAGFVAMEPDISINAHEPMIAPRPAIFVTGGAPASVVCTISNSGETVLSFVSVYHENTGVKIGGMDCPAILPVGGAISFTNHLMAGENSTNTWSVTAMSVNPITCEELAVDPVFVTLETEIIVVSPEDASDYDADGMSDWEEYVAGTDGTDTDSIWSLGPPSGDPPAITIPTTSTGRIYVVHSTTDPSAGDETWLPVATEQPGTGGDMTLVITNVQPGAMFRASVHLP